MDRCLATLEQRAPLHSSEEKEWKWAVSSKVVIVAKGKNFCANLKITCKVDRISDTSPRAVVPQEAWRKRQPHL